MKNFRIVLQWMNLTPCHILWVVREPFIPVSVCPYLSLFCQEIPRPQQPGGSLLTHFLAVWPWSSSLTSLGLLSSSIKWDNESSYPGRLLWGINTLTSAKHMVSSLWCPKTRRWNENKYIKPNTGEISENEFNDIIFKFLKIKLK